jgi:hypothetical protein
MTEKMITAIFNLARTFLALVALIGLAVAVVPQHGEISFEYGALYAYPQLVLATVGVLTFGGFTRLGTWFRICMFTSIARQWKGSMDARRLERGITGDFDITTYCRDPCLDFSHHRNHLAEGAWTESMLLVREQAECATNAALMRAEKRRQEYGVDVWQSPCYGLYPEISSTEAAAGVFIMSTVIAAVGVDMLRVYFGEMGPWSFLLTFLTFTQRDFYNTVGMTLLCVLVFRGKIGFREYCFLGLLISHCPASWEYMGVDALSVDQVVMLNAPDFMAWLSGQSATILEWTAGGNWIAILGVIVTGLKLINLVTGQFKGLDLISLVVGLLNISTNLTWVRVLGDCLYGFTPDGLLRELISWVSWAIFSPITTPGWIGSLGNFLSVSGTWSVLCFAILYVIFRWNNRVRIKRLQWRRPKGGWEPLLRKMLTNQKWLGRDTVNAVNDHQAGIIKTRDLIEVTFRDQFAIIDVGVPVECEWHPGMLDLAHSRLKDVFVKTIVTDNTRKSLSGVQLTYEELEEASVVFAQMAQFLTNEYLRTLSVSGKEELEFGEEPLRSWFNQCREFLGIRPWSDYDNVIRSEVGCSMYMYGARLYAQYEGTKAYEFVYRSCFSRYSMYCDNDALGMKDMAQAVARLVLARGGKRSGF